MPLIVQPRGGLTIAPPPGSAPTVDIGLPLELRAQALEAFFQRVTVALALDGERLQRAEQTVQKLAAVGMLILPDGVASFEQLASLDWLEVWEDVELPKVNLPMPLQAAGAVRPWHLGMIRRPTGPGVPTGASVSIGVIDSGYDPAFPDLGGFNPTFAKYVDATPTTSGGMTLNLPPQDASPVKHGSLVCVMLAGASCGVAPGASFYVASISAATFPGTQSRMVAAVNWLLSVPHPVRTNGCDIITTSLFTGNKNATVQGTPIAALLNTVEAANTLMIAAVGNDGPGNTRPPGSSPKVMAVGAVDQSRNIAGFSGYSLPTKPDILAPGKSVEVPDGTASGKKLIEGTSFAAPIVAGAAALVLDRNPALRSNLTQFRNTVLGLVSPPSSGPWGISPPAHGICDLTNI